MTYVNSLTQREADFARLIVYEEMPQYKAYMQAYNCDKKSSAYAESCRVAKKPRVVAEIQRLRDELSAEAMWTRLDSIKTLKSVAESAEKDSDRVQAVNSINKMFGWDKQTIEHTGADGGPIETAIQINYKPVGSKNG